MGSVGCMLIMLFVFCKDRLIRFVWVFKSSDEDQQTYQTVQVIKTAWILPCDNHATEDTE